MRRNNFSLRPRANDVRMQVPEQPQPTPPTNRKTFNCIVDETALIAGVKRSTRDGIRKWVSQGAIRLYIPLHTLAQLDRIKKGSERINSDAREAIKWLDEATEQSSNVQLEGVEEAFGSWEEVEQYLLPETLLSMEESESEDDAEYPEDLDSSFAHLDVSDETSLSSSHSLDEPPKSPQSTTSATSGKSATLSTVRQNSTNCAINAKMSPDRTARNSAELPRTAQSPRGVIPVYLQPLFNHIMWRIHKDTNPDVALESFILLTNDPGKQAIAQKFGIRAKRLEQLRDAVAREDREVKNHQTMRQMENGVPKSLAPADRTIAESNVPERPKSSHTQEKIDSDDEDVVLLKRAPRGPQAQTVNGRGVWDPNDFGRPGHHNNGPRGGRGGFGPRGRGGPPRGRGGFVPRGAYAPPAMPFRPPPRRVERMDPNQPIDPDSFARPNPRVNTMRGTRRKLWEPN